MSDVVHFRSQDPPTAVIWHLSGVTIQQHSSEADLPQADVTKAGVDARPWYVPVRRTVRENEAQKTENVQN